MHDKQLKKAVFLYDYTGYAAEPWLAAGYECWLFDGQHPLGVRKEGNLYKVGVWFDAYTTRSQVEEIAALVGDNVKIVIGFPACTDMAVSGARHFSKKQSLNPAFQAEACELARLVMYLGGEVRMQVGSRKPSQCALHTLEKA